MRYYKLIESGYITLIGTGGGGTEITEQEYIMVKAAIMNKPPETATTDYRLKADMTWEEFPRIKPDPEPQEDMPDNLEENAAYLLRGGMVEIPDMNEDPDYFNEHEPEPEYFG